MFGRTDTLGASCSIFPCQSNPKPLNSDSPSYFVYSTSILFSGKQKSATENFSSNSHQTCMSFDNVLQEKESVRSGVEVKDHNTYYARTSQPPMPSRRGQHSRSPSRPPTMSNTHQHSTVPNNTDTTTITTTPQHQHHQPQQNTATSLRSENITIDRDKVISFDFS